nr:ATP synthase F0 subunit 8 [Alcedoecus sp.]
MPQMFPMYWSVLFLIFSLFFLMYFSLTVQMYMYKETSRKSWLIKKNGWL